MCAAILKQFSNFVLFAFAFLNDLNTMANWKRDDSLEWASSGWGAASSSYTHPRPSNGYTRVYEGSYAAGSGETWSTGSNWGDKPLNADQLPPAPPLPALDVQTVRRALQRWPYGQPNEPRGGLYRDSRNGDVTSRRILRI